MGGLRTFEVFVEQQGDFKWWFLHPPWEWRDDAPCRPTVLGFSCSDVERAGKAHDDGQCMYGAGDIRW